MCLVLGWGRVQRNVIIAAPWPCRLSSWGWGRRPVDLRGRPAGCACVMGDGVEIREGPSGRLPREAWCVGGGSGRVPGPATCSRCITRPLPRPSALPPCEGLIIASRACGCARACDACQTSRARTGVLIEETTHDAYAITHGGGGDGKAARPPSIRDAPAPPACACARTSRRHESLLSTGPRVAVPRYCDREAHANAMPSIQHGRSGRQR